MPEIREIEANIRAHIRASGRATREALDWIERALASHPNTFELWILLGDAIQLSNDDGDGYTLEDARQSYRRAAALAPRDPAPLISLGYFYYAILDRAAESIAFFERAVELGGGAEAREGLAEARAELAEHGDDGT